MRSRERLRPVSYTHLDSMVAELCELNRNMMMSVDIIPVPTDEAVREVENRLLGVETHIPVSYTHLDVYKRQPSEDYGV